MCHKGSLHDSMFCVDRNCVRSRMTLFSKNVNICLSRLLHGVFMRAHEWKYLQISDWLIGLSFQWIDWANIKKVVHIISTKFSFLNKANIWLIVHESCGLLVWMSIHTMMAFTYFCACYYNNTNHLLWWWLFFLTQFPQVLLLFFIALR